MKILVTGGAGFIGSNIVDSYIELGHEVLIIDNLSSGKKDNINPRAKFFQADIRNAREIKTIFTKEKPDVLNHHAAQINLRKSVMNPVFDAKVNIIGILNLLEAGVKNKLKKVIFASSGGAIYGEAKILPTPENYEPKQPLSPYGIAKMMSEYYLNYYFNSYGLNFAILRYSNVYGPRQDPFGEGGVVAIFSQKLFKKKTPVINGDGKQTRDFVFVKDVVEANVLALNKNINRAINIATGIETSVNKLYKLLSNKTNILFSEIHGPSKTGEQQRSILDITLAKKILGWKPGTTLDEGLNQAINFFRI